MLIVGISTLVLTLLALVAAGLWKLFKEISDNHTSLLTEVKNTATSIAVHAAADGTYRDKVDELRDKVKDHDKRLNDHDAVLRQWHTGDAVLIRIDAADLHKHARTEDVI